MEILFVSHKHPPTIGGMENQSFELVRGMKKHATVYTIVYDGRGSRFAFFVSLQRRILTICQQHPGISIIHFNDGLIAAACSWHQSYKHLHRTVTLHGLDVVFPSRMYRRHVFPLLNKFQLIFTVSNATADACIKQGLLPEKVVVVNNGVEQPGANAALPTYNTLALAPGDINLNNKKFLVAIGRPVKRKGFSWFIQHVVPRLNADTLLLLIGPFRKRAPLSERLLNVLPVSVQKRIELFLGYPSDEKQIRQLLTQPGLANKVIHLGKLSFEHKISLLNLATAFIVPNIPVEGDMEGFGLVCLEACACGTTVFASNIDGIPDAIQDGKNGYLLPAGDAEAWSVALNSHLELNGVSKLSKEAIKTYTLSRFNWGKMVDEYYQHFKQLIPPSKPGAFGPTNL